MPKVSVIIPNYNHAPYLKERIDSVLNQNYQDFEVIILDDCSTDNSREVIETYNAHPKISHIIFNEQNSGSTFKQWKKGIDIAKGEWIWIAESDDFCETIFLESLLRQEKEDTSLIYCASNLIDDQNLKITDTWVTFDNNVHNWEDNLKITGTEYIAKFLFTRNTIPNASAVIFKKNSLDGSIFEELMQMKFAGDWFFWVKILAHGTLSYTPERLNYFRVHQNTTRTLKSLSLENQRVKEYFIVLNYIHQKYTVDWNFKKHLWIIREWSERQNQLDKRKFKIFHSSFPLSYKLILIKGKASTAYWKISDYIDTKVKSITNRSTKIPLPPEKFKKILISTEKVNETIPRIIWTYWESDIIPDFVQNCFNNIKRNNPDFQLRILNADNVYKYLDYLPEEINFSLIHKTDYIRLALLSRYGGIYIDGATALSKSLDWIIDIQTESKTEFVGFYNPTFMNSEVPFVESWFLASVKDSQFIKDWFQEFSKAILSGNFKDYYKSESNYSKLKQKLPRFFEDYLVIHLSAQKLLNQKNYNIFVIDCTDEALFYRYATKPAEEPLQYANFLLAAYAPEKISKIIKFTGGDRKALEKYQKKYQVNKNSILKKLEIL